MYTIFALLVLCTVSYGSRQKRDAVECEHPYFLVEDACIRIDPVLDHVGYRHHQAKAICEREGATLFWFTTAQEFYTVHDLIVTNSTLTQRPKYWLDGIKDPNGVWKWESLNDVIYSYLLLWGPKEPNNLRNREKNMNLLQKRGYMLNDAYFRRQCGYICKKAMSPCARVACGIDSTCEVQDNAAVCTCPNENYDYVADYGCLLSGEEPDWCLVTECGSNAWCYSDDDGGHCLCDSSLYEQIGDEPGCILRECRVGYYLTNDTVRCEDVDECQTPDSCLVNSDCSNKVGRYWCLCDDGEYYDREFGCVSRGGCSSGEVHDGSTCVDINECLRYHNPCRAQSRCINRPNGNGYYCSCKEGYDYHSRIGCHLEPCEEGYYRAAGSIECIDIDECDLLGDRACAGFEATCTNKADGFSCDCLNEQSVYDQMKGCNYPLNLGNGCEAIADVIIVLDSSSSIGTSDFNLMRTFTMNLVEQFDIGSDRIRVGIFRYNRDVFFEFSLQDYFVKSELLAAIESLEYSGSGTYTHLALREAIDAGFNVTNGHRPDVRKVAIIVTDGESRYPDLTLEEAENLRNISAHVFAVGIGDVNMNEIHGIASSPAENNVFIGANFDQLEDMYMGVARGVCQASCNAADGICVQCPSDYVSNENGCYMDICALSTPCVGEDVVCFNHYGQAGSTYSCLCQQEHHLYDKDNSCQDVSAGSHSYVILYDGSSFDGDFLTIGDNRPDLSNVDFNDKTQSIRVAGSKSWAFYDLKNYGEGGSWVVLQPGDYDMTALQQLAMDPSIVSSLKVYYGNIQECPEEWTSFQDMCYQPSLIKATFWDAVDYCAEYDSNVLVLKSPGESNFVLNNLVLPYFGGEYYRVWLGLVDEEDDEVWSWVNGHDYESGWKNWEEADIPDDNSHRDCAAAEEHTISNNFTWDHKYCGSSLYHVICSLQINEARR